MDPFAMDLTEMGRRHSATDAEDDLGRHVRRIHEHPESIMRFQSFMGPMTSDPEAELAFHQAVAGHGDDDESEVSHMAARRLVRHISSVQDLGVASGSKGTALLDDDALGMDDMGPGVQASDDASEKHKAAAEAAKPPSAWTIRAFLGIPPGPITAVVAAWLVLRILFMGFLFWRWTVVLNKDELKNAAWVLIMGLVAVMIPSGGAPVAGGVLFFPLLKTFAGFSPPQAVSFSASCQAVGVFVLTSVNWLVRSPAVFSKPVLVMAAIPTTMVTVGTLFLLAKYENDTIKLTTEIVFALFCTYLAYSITKGIFKGNLLSQNGRFTVDCQSIFHQVLISFFGGILSALLGIGVEKISFLYLTKSRHKLSTLRAGISSIVIIGLASVGASLLDLLYIRHKSDKHMADWEKMSHYWLMAMPGIVVGSMCGPWLNQLVGPKRILMVFVVFLVLDIGKTVFDVIHTLK